MTTYRVKNWRKFQHYTDRNPPWIKLHFEMLSSADWVMLDDRSRVLAIACMLVASRNEGYVPSDGAYLRRVAYLNKTPDFKPLIKCGFLEVASDCKQMIAYARPETEAETEAEEETEGEREGASKRPSPKLKYLDFILLTEHEHAEIVAKLNGNAGAYLERLNGYIGQTGRRYKSHYHTILNWYRKDVDAGKVFTDPEPPAPVEKCSSCGVRAAFKNGVCAPCLSEAKVKA